MQEIIKTQKQLKTAVLFIVFNRPDTTLKVFEAIRQVKPEKLYIAADGPRKDNHNDKESVEQVREIATKVDWPCEVKKLFREENLGCKNAVCFGIDWFFENEEHGIILEDDCVPHFEFFAFCESLLERYAKDDRIWAITGDNFQNGIMRGDGSYYFSRFNHVWGWASWRRAWVKRDMSIRFWPEWRASSEWKSWLPDKIERQYWTNIFDKMYCCEIDSWAYPWTASVWYYEGLTATPNVNLVSNIGFGPNATHTGNVNDPKSMISNKSIGFLIHPTSIEQDTDADLYVFNHIFGGKNKRFPRSLFRMILLKINYSFTTFKKFFLDQK
jgi:hypothetical protein